MPSISGQKRAIHFDLSQKVLDSQNLDCATVYRHIRTWMDEHGFDHDQLSGYVSRQPLTDRQARHLHEAFVLDNPQIAACLEGIRATRVDEGMDFSQSTTRLLKQINPRLAQLSQQSRAIRESRNTHRSLRIHH